jgi:outer membrane protein assembly factor BamA
MATGSDQAYWRRRTLFRELSMNTDLHRSGGAHWRGLVLGLFCALLPLSLAAQDSVPDAAPDSATEADGPSVDTTPAIITRIEFVGNRVTEPRIMLQEMLVKVGDVADPALIERSRQAIMDLGLFVSVKAALETNEDGAVLRITVKEKYYILPVPKLNRNEDNNTYSWGGELALNNLAGLNQTLKVRYESQQADALSGGKTETSLLSYDYPRVFGGPYEFRTDITQVRTPAEVVTNGVLESLYELQGRTVSMQVSRWLAPIGPSRGWQVGGGLVWRRNNYDYVDYAPTSTLQDSQAVGVSVLGQYVDVHDYLYSRSGVQYGYTGEYGAPLLGSDTLYTRHAFFYRHYILLDGRPHENFEFQSLLSLSSGDVFLGDTYAYAIGGSRTLRGYTSGSITGNAFVILNVQYLRPFFGYYPLRGVVFVDIGNAYPSNERINLGDLKWSTGLGLRFRLKSFVNIELRVDVAYAYDTGQYKIIAGTKEAF